MYKINYYKLLSNLNLMRCVLQLLKSLIVKVAEFGNPLTKTLTKILFFIYVLCVFKFVCLFGFFFVCVCVFFLCVCVCVLFF